MILEVSLEGLWTLLLGSHNSMVIVLGLVCEVVLSPSSPKVNLCCNLNLCEHN